MTAVWHWIHLSWVTQACVSSIKNINHCWAFNTRALSRWPPTSDLHSATVGFGRFTQPSSADDYRFWFFVCFLHMWNRRRSAATGRARKTRSIVSGERAQSKTKFAADERTVAKSLPSFLFPLLEEFSDAPFKNAALVIKSSCLWLEVMREISTKALSNSASFFPLLNYFQLVFVSMNKLKKICWNLLFTQDVINMQNYAN